MTWELIWKFKSCDLTWDMMHYLVSKCTLGMALSWFNDYTPQHGMGQITIIMPVPRVFVSKKKKMTWLALTRLDLTLLDMIKKKWVESHVSCRPQKPTGCWSGWIWDTTFYSMCPTNGLTWFLLTVSTIIIIIYNNWQWRSSNLNKVVILPQTLIVPHTTTKLF